MKFAKYFTALLLLYILLFGESPQPQNVTLDVFFFFPLNIFRANNVNHLHVAISGVPKQLIVTELIYC